MRHGFTKMLHRAIRKFAPRRGENVNLLQNIQVDNAFRKARFLCPPLVLFCELEKFHALKGKNYKILLIALRLDKVAGLEGWTTGKMRGLVCSGHHMPVEMYFKHQSILISPSISIPADKLA